MADAIPAAFKVVSAAPIFPPGWGKMGCAMIEMLFIYQLARNPLQAIARRWYCRGLFRATRGRRRCPESTKS
jgi:hypothetical protein